jgi:hypothetical protein
MMEGGGKSFHTSVVPNFGLRIGVNLFIVAPKRSGHSLFHYFYKG